MNTSSTVIAILLAVMVLAIAGIGMYHEGTGYIEPTPEDKITDADVERHVANKLADADLSFSAISFEGSVLIIGIDGSAYWTSTQKSNMKRFPK